MKLQTSGAAFLNTKSPGYLPNIYKIFTFSVFYKF